MAQRVGRSEMYRVTNYDSDSGLPVNAWLVPDPDRPWHLWVIDTGWLEEGPVDGNPFLLTVEALLNRMKEFPSRLARWEADQTGALPEPQIVGLLITQRAPDHVGNLSAILARRQGESPGVWRDCALFLPGSSKTTPDGGGRGKQPWESALSDAVSLGNVLTAESAGAGLTELAGLPFPIRLDQLGERTLISVLVPGPETALISGDLFVNLTPDGPTAPSRRLLAHRPEELRPLMRLLATDAEENWVQWLLMGHGEPMRALKPGGLATRMKEVAK
jgi:glyoxylase-like metal-dependent hydrolase (beta-lactamase superfamily II)